MTLYANSHFDRFPSDGEITLSINVDNYNPVCESINQLHCLLKTNWIERFDSDEINVRRLKVFKNCAIYSIDWKSVYYPIIRKYYLM